MPGLREAGLCDTEQMADPQDLRAVPRQHARLDGLDLYSRLAEMTGRRIDDPAQIADTLETIRASLEATTTQESTVYGWMAQNMFEGLVASLGSIKLLKTEDGGGIYVAGDDATPPDFRIVTGTGDRLLVEVKAHYQREPDSDFTIRTKDLDALKAYADTIGGHRLLFAIYWTRWNLWTLTDINEFREGPGSRQSLPMEQAAMRNELALLGDCIIGTESPLTLRLYADPSKHRRITDNGEALSFTVAAVEQTVAGKIISDAAEQRLALFLMFYGRWEDHLEINENDDVLESVSLVTEPEPDLMNRPDTHGWLSSIYSTWFLHTTTNSDGHIVALRANVTPSMLTALIPEATDASVLKLWRFYTRPNDSSTPNALSLDRMERNGPP